MTDPATLELLERPPSGKAVVRMTPKGHPLVDLVTAETAPSPGATSRRGLLGALGAAGLAIETIRIDGGMSVNPTFVQALADATGHPIEVAPVAESTTIGAAFMAGLGVGTWTEMNDLDRLWRPARIVEPTPGYDRTARRTRWADAIDRAAGWIPELSALQF